MPQCDILIDTISSITGEAAVKKSTKYAHRVRRLIENVLVWRVLRAKAAFTKVLDHGLDIDGFYYLTSEKGVYGMDRSGLYRILRTGGYGIAMRKDRVFLSVDLPGLSLIVRGRLHSFLRGAGPMDFDEITRVRVRSSNERFHGMFATDSHLFAANTARNTILKIDLETDEIHEYPLFVDRFGANILYDLNHVNSISCCGGVLLFTAYSAGKQSMIGVYDNGRVTGFGYRNAGVHDIYMTPDGFYFCDTFGDAPETRGGSVETERGTLDGTFFSMKDDGYVVRGLAGSRAEMLIGHSHQGPRSKRFDGRGGVIVARNGKVSGFAEVVSAQVYQIIRRDGLFLDEEANGIDGTFARARLAASLGEPIYDIHGMEPWVVREAKGAH